MTPPTLRSLFTAASLLALVALAVAYASRTPRPLDASAPVDAFSATRAMRHVAAVAHSPHPTGSTEHARVRDYVAAQLTAMGVTPVLQRTTGIGTRYPVVGRVDNVIGRVTGTDGGGRAVLLVAHYDGVPAAPAAGDDGAGTAVLLETVRALRAGPPLAHDVIVLFTDAEEAGLLGAAAFAREHPWARDVNVVLNFEARGVRGPSLMFETGPGNHDVVRVLRGVSGVKATSLSTTVYRRLPNDTDLSELAALGRPALNFAFIGGVDHYHTALDDTASLSAGSVQHHGNNALALVRALAAGPLPRPVTGDAVFFDFPILGLIVYPESWALPIALLGLALVVAVAVRARVSLAGAALGTAGMLVTLLLAGGVAYGASRALAAIHAALPTGGTPQFAGVYAAAVALLTLAVALAVHVLVTRRVVPRAVHAGVLVLWAALVVLVSATAPGVSFLFAWPLIAAAAAAAAPAPIDSPGRERGRTARAVTTWLAAFVVIMIVAPTVYLMVCVALGLDPAGAIVVSTLTALSAWLLAPQLAALADGRHHAATLAAAGALVLFVFGITTVRNDGRHPAGASLLYAVDADSGTAWLAGSATNAYARRWVSVTQRTLAQSDARPPAWLARFGRAGVRVASPAASQAAAVTVRADSAAAGGAGAAGASRVVTLRVVPPPGALAISFDADSGVIAAAVDGLPISTDRYRARPRRWRLDYVAPSDSGFTLRLTLSPGTHAMLGVTARVSGLPVTASRPARPAGVVPVQWGDATITYRRISF